ncbi:MAG: UDP-N-acetylmuramoyl-tripeptide--D-alanyl-D-alanine ligase, partial [Phycisphaerales bacterium]
MKGDRFDGHDFVIDAVAAGAQVVIVERDPGPLLRPAFVIKVPSTRKALLRLAAAYRDALTRTRVVAICGSNGKTTTTALINAVLSTRFRGSASAKSFNNDIGVPLTILSAKTADQFLLCEVGTNAPGEIAALAAVVRPDLAVITSIGREHLLGFGSIEGVAREEAAVLQHLRPAEPGAPSAIVTADSPALTEHLRSLPGLLTFGRHGSADLRLTAFEHFCSTGAGVPDSIRFSVNARAAFSAPLIGEHNAVNALAAIAVARRFGLSDAEIARGLAAATPPEMRLATVEAAGIRIVNDAYNANPDSTLAALRTFAAIHAAADRRVVVLGDNLELGDHAPAAHREIGETILELGCIDLLITVGPLAARAALEHDWPPHRL